MRIAIDANIWIAERLLRSSMGAALLYALKRKNGAILLPSATRAEVIAGVRRDGQEIVDTIQDALGLLQALRGERPEIPLPSQEDFEKSAEARLIDLAPMIQDMQHSTDHLEAALRRVVDHRPPAHKKEEFRDALFWELAKSAALQGPIHILARDAAFYEGSKFENGLAKELRAECDASGASITIFASVESFLTGLGQDVLQPDRDDVTSALETALTAHFEKIASASPFDLGALRRAGIEAFLTEKHDQLAVRFELAYDVQNLTTTTDVFPEAALEASGSANYNLDTKTVSNVQVTSTSFHSPDGRRLIGHRTIYASGSAVIGIRQVPYTLRRKLN
jgi:hypothetical protein